MPPPAPTAAVTPPEAPARVVYVDNQLRIAGSVEEAYSAYRLRILKPEALAAGNVSVSWTPSAGDVTVHMLRVIRGDQVTDVLAATKFRILQREGGLEQSMLNGQLTATLQVPGLQIGDELEFAATVTRREPAFGTHFAGVGQFPALGMPGALRFRLQWPETKPLTWRATKDLPQQQPETAGGEKSLVYELRDPKGAIPTEGAPNRFNVRRLIEYSDFATWTDVSRLFWPVYDKASRIAPGSELRAEATRIAAAHPTQSGRAQAALQFVQDRIRYVYVGLDGGNYAPASADETWKRRFGDCKGKTALLLALLRELGVEAQPVLVNLGGGDGTDERLPSPRMFDHILVRASIDGAPHWLDGTRLGDRHLDTVPPPTFRWALPVSAAGTDLERVVAAGPAAPGFTGVVTIDASAGFDAKAKVEAQNILRGDEALAMRMRLAALSAEDADRAVEAYWREQLGWVEPDTVSWRYDDRRAALILAIAGQGPPEWTGDDKDGRSLIILGAGFYPPEPMRRPKEQDQAAAWAVEYPRFRCWATTIRLPATNSRWGWKYESDPVDRRLGGVAYWRASGMRGGVMRTVMSRKSLAPEISAADAALLNTQIAGFNNNMSSVFQIATASAKSDSASLPFADGVDWVVDPAPCAAPDAVKPVAGK